MNAVFPDPPKDFNPSLEAAGCYCEWKDKILLLKRSPHKPQGHTWGIPGGKLEEGETPRGAVVREVYEEVGIRMQEAELEEIGRMYVRRPPLDYIFYRFRKSFLTPPVLHLSLEEHMEARWVTVEEALELPLIYGGVEAMTTYKKFREEKGRVRD